MAEARKGYFFCRKDDPEESALSLNGKKHKLKAKDFFAFAQNLGLSQKQVEGIFKKFSKNISLIEPCVRASFMPPSMQDAYISLSAERAKRLGF